MKFGLHGIRKLLNELDHPENKFPTVHIAGTNGKGSTASMIASMFTAAGYKTGLYTSQHLVRFQERIRIDGVPIGPKKVAYLTDLVKEYVSKNQLTFFETVTAIAFKYFADSQVDIAIIETGLGGRLDATNVIRPIVSIITTIGKEHTDLLGSSIEKIASEKGGIIKTGIPCLSGVSVLQAKKVLKGICRDKKSEFFDVRSKRILIKDSTLENLILDYRTSRTYLLNLKISLAGDFQVRNILLALSAIEIIEKQSNFRISASAIRTGLAHIQQFSGLQGRLSIIRQKPLFIVDVAHNPDAIKALCNSLRQLHIEKVNIILGLMQDKDYKQILQSISKISNIVFVVKAKTERSRSSDEIGLVCKQLGIKSRIFNNVVEGVSVALRTKDLPVLMTGSHFVVGEGLAYLQSEKYLTINQ